VSAPQPAASLAGPAGALDVGEVLRRHPDVAFDLEEHVIGTRHADRLVERLERWRTAATTIDAAAAADAIVRGLCDGACDWIPRYRGYAKLRTLDEAPLVEKRDVRRAPDEFLSVAYEPDELWAKTTTGSSGPPIPIWYSGDFYFDLLHLSVPKIAERARVPGPDGSGLYCLALSDNRASSDFVVAVPSGEARLSMQVVVDERRSETFERLFALVEELRPWCISSKPSLFEMLAAWTERGASFGSHIPTLFVSSGAQLGEALRERLQGLADVVVSAYAMTEFGLIASECPAGACHVDTSAVCVEVVDDQGAPLPEGSSGELVLSSLSNAAMPLLRYRTGDLGAVEVGRCACGSVQPRITNMNGRKIVCYVLPSGELFSPTYFNDLFARFEGLEEFQLTQQSVGVYEVRVELEDGHPDPTGTLERLRTYVGEAIPGSPAVVVVPTRFDTDSKFERYRTAC
jgi:phenylacetate-CoA ligase